MKAAVTKKRTKIIVPDSAHGTNPASAAMVGFSVISIPSADDGGVDLEELKKSCRGRYGRTDADQSQYIRSF